ncbi:A-kinase anchor protein 200-like isoform X2 [Neodiprion virginianus]|uniref:A-kinase anchor protein 200 isoform X2 n=1 Tax=Neodiprion lecontei TaxID=441921 RepID=A0ABM3FUA2_NEOLC|nr:A-kinase anchor protein 200 isoform X2 [Neodiprion lecontei]XP_046611808.1 A-kinase anchor protein 200-like isoform X2 [Neodiprion virginianus]
MGARQSKRSVDITTTPKKDGIPAEGSVAGDAAAPGDGKLERIEESDGKPTTNGTAPHSDAVVDDKDKEKEKEQDKDKENDKDKDKDEDTEKEEVKVEDTRQESSNTDTPAVAEEATTPTDGNTTPISPESATSPDSKDAKKKDKKKKWSLRSLSFGKKDRSKTAREDAPKNGDVTKEEPLAEGGEEAEVAAPVEESPAEEKTEVSSPTVESTPAVAPAPVKEEEKAAPASPTPVEEKKEEPTPAPTPVPVEEKKEEIEKVEPVVVADKVEKIAEPEAPAENPAEVSATESVTEAPASPAPPVPAELPVLPPSEPALTEDVASVTKAIEDFEISDKAVAAAVNEAIESNNANEIVNDSLHQKVITE